MPVDSSSSIKAQANGVLHYQGQNSCTDGEYARTANGADCLPPQLVESAAVEQTRDSAGASGAATKPDQQRTDDAADQVHADHVERVIEAQFVFQADGQRTQHARQTPTASAPTTLTDEQDGVIATRPATMPDAAPSDVALPSRMRSVSNQAEHRRAQWQSSW